MIAPDFHVLITNVSKMLMMGCGGLVRRNNCNYSQPSSDYINPQSDEQRTNNGSKATAVTEACWDNPCST